MSIAASWSWVLFVLTHSVARRGCSLQVMSADALGEMRVDAQQQVTSVWGVEAYQARALLMTFNWNIDLLQGEAGPRGPNPFKAPRERQPHVPSRQRWQIHRAVVARHTLLPALRPRIPPQHLLPPTDII